MNENQQPTSSGGGGGNTNHCCEFFVDVLNSRAVADYNDDRLLVIDTFFDSLVTPPQHSELDSSSGKLIPAHPHPPDQIAKQLLINDRLTSEDVDAFLMYCQVWQQK
jgi:hypothetical protein